MNLRRVVLAAFLFLASSALYAQDDPNPAAIEKLKQTKVSAVEKGLPDLAFDSWLSQLTGPETTINYESNDCGERDGTPDEKGKSFPLCVEARVDSSNGLALVLTFSVGTFIAEPNAKPDLKTPTQFFSGSIVRKDDQPVSDIKKLSDAPAAWKAANTAKPGKKKS